MAQILTHAVCFTYFQVDVSVVVAFTTTVGEALASSADYVEEITRDKVSAGFTLVII